MKVGTAVSQEKKVTAEWVFIPLLKKHIYKRTDTYILFDVNGKSTGIINAKFLRKKETEDMVFISLPADYKVNCNVRENIDGKWVTTSTYVLTGKELRPIVLDYNNELPF